MVFDQYISFSWLRSNDELVLVIKPIKLPKKIGEKMWRYFISEFSIHFEVACIENRIFILGGLIGGLGKNKM